MLVLSEIAELHSRFSSTVRFDSEDDYKGVDNENHKNKFYAPTYASAFIVMLDELNIFKKRVQTLDDKIARHKLTNSIDKLIKVFNNEAQLVLFERKPHEYLTFDYEKFQDWAQSH